MGIIDESGLAPKRREIQYLPLEANPRAREWRVQGPASDNEPCSALLSVARLLSRCMENVLACASRNQLSQPR